jgi:hypothetical protein
LHRRYTSFIEKTVCCPNSNLISKRQAASLNVSEKKFRVWQTQLTLAFQGRLDFTCCLSVASFLQPRPKHWGLGASPLPLFFQKMRSPMPALFSHASSLALSRKRAFQLESREDLSRLRALHLLTPSHLLQPSVIRRESSPPGDHPAYSEEKIFIKPY